MKEIQLTTADIRRAADDGVISPDDSRALITWAENRSHRAETGQMPPEAVKGLNLVTVAYYFGAMLMIVACGWFLGDKWDVLGSGGVLITSVVYCAVAGLLGWWLRGKGYIVGGGLLITVAVCLVPLITYSTEDLLGFWPAGRPGDYKEYYPRVHGSWIVMEWATILAALVALRFAKFGFLTAPLAFSFWFFSMDIAEIILGGRSLDWNSRAWVSVVVGIITMAIGFALERSMHKAGEPRSEDFAFWCYLFGLMAFWGGLTSMDSDSEIGRAIYAVINVGLIGVALKLRRAVFLVFGAVGVYLYLGHLAYDIFKDSFLFPFVLAFLGLTLIIATVVAGRAFQTACLNSWANRIPCRHVVKDLRNLFHLLRLYFEEINEVSYTRKCEFRIR